jgi:hypothetical protein
MHEQVAVIRPRTERLLALGYEQCAAARLAASEVDVRELEHLIRNGCPPQAAAQIAS